MLNKRIVIAHQIKSKGGSIWIPPNSRPYWIEYPNSRRELTNDEIRKYIKYETP
jgi:hypothetical protein